MRIIRDPARSAPESPASAVALGVFDGMHLAHRSILQAAVAAAREGGIEAVACTFDPHPMQVLRPERAPAPIATLAERLELMAATGLDATVVLTFTPQIAQVEPEAFVKDVILARLRAREVIVGYNHTFGRGARGDPGLLQELGERLGFRARVVPPFLVDGEPVSSSAIRAALSAGDLDRANRMLGRPYAVAGEVVEGSRRGRTLGFPTANVRADRPLLAATGVYACLVEVAGRSHPAVVNIGVRPTFGEATVVVEAHLLDFTGDLYGAGVRVAFLARLREERRFSGPEALQAQIRADLEAARRHFGDADFTRGRFGGSLGP
jgi:riboflavin kinase/FMN adenylyltransferase